MARFPHIGGSTDGKAYPYMKNVKPYKRDVTFDYTRYDYPVEVKLCSVPWPIDYRHTVAWEDAAARDAYFEGLDGYTQEVKALELMQGFARVQLDSIRLDLPYDEALTYNYLYTRVPMLTEDAPIRHEGENGMRTVCAFVESCTYLAPSTTELVLSLDMWTTYLPYLAIEGLMLRRGHAPMYKTDAAAYLADPVNKCADLLTPDVNFGGSAEITRSGEAKPLSTAEPFYVFASTIPYSDIATLARATVTTATAPTFSDDTSARNGHQLTVGGYAWNTRGASNMYNPTKTVSCADGSTPSGLYYYGVYASAMASGAFESLFSTYPLLAKTTKALYVVPSDLVTRGTAHTVSTFTFYELQSKPGLQTLGSFTLTKAMFGYATEYADIAKLYTSPYASLELADDLGNVVPLRVENCHNTLAISQHLNMAFPFLSWDAMVTNYASTTAANATYNWRKLNDGTTEARSIPNADFMETAIAFGIDTYELRLEACPLAQIDSYYDADYQREAAIKAYQATMRSANTGLENAEDSNYTANYNTLESNATAHTNAHNSNNTAQLNTEASANMAHVNAYRSAENSYNMADYQAGSNARLATINTDSNDTLQTLSEVSMQEMHSNKEIYEATMFNLGTQAQQLRDITSAVPSFLSGDVPGLALSAMSSLVNLSLSQSQYETTKTYNVYRESDTIAANRRGTNAQNSRVSLTTSEQNTTTRYVANNNRNTAELNADDIKTVTNDNAVRTQTAGNDNADLTKTTADANANRTRGTADANAEYSRATTEENAKAALLLAQDAYTTRIEGAGVDNPAAFGSATGDGLANSYRMRNVHLRAKTQSDSAISRAGDAFLRYGYTYDGIWEISSWCPTGHDFCYWQASDLWLSSADIANPQAERALESILEAGTTIWADPDKIGRVRI